MAKAGCMRCYYANIRMLFIFIPILLFNLVVSFAAAETVTITFMHWSDPNEFNALIEAFEAKNPDIKINHISSVTGGFNFPDKLRTMFAAGMPPETFRLDTQEVAYFAQKGLVADLRPFAEKEPGFNLDQIMPMALDMMTYKGGLYGLSPGVGSNFYFYNADMFEAAGIPSPYQQYRSGGWTWNDFRSAAMKLTRTGGENVPSVMGAAVHFGSALARLWMFSNGAPEFDDVMIPTKCLYDAPESVQAYDFLQRLLHIDRVAAHSNADIGNQDTTKAFLAGRLAMMARWTAGAVIYGDASHRFGIVPYPKGPSSKAKHAADFTGAGYAMPKDNPHTEAAWRFIAFAASFEGQSIHPGSVGPNLTTRRGIRPEFLPSNMVNPEMLPEMLTLPNQGNQMRLSSINQLDINRLISNGLRPIWQNQKAPAIALQELTAEVNAFLRDNPQD